MVERSDEIKQRIDLQRGELGENLHELERRVKSTTDWRAHMEKRPWLMLGAAFGTGMLAAGVLGRSRHSSSYYGSSYSGMSTPRHSTSSQASESRFKNFREQRHRAADALDKMTGALIAVGVQKLQDVLKESIPGFGEKYEHSESRPEAGTERATGDREQSFGGYGQSESGRYDKSPSPAV